MVTVNFPQADAQTIDNDYDDGNSKTGAFRGRGEIHPDDPRFATFKAKYTADIRANLEILTTPGCRASIVRKYLKSFALIMPAKSKNI